MRIQPLLASCLGFVLLAGCAARPIIGSAPSAGRAPDASFASTRHAAVAVPMASGERRPLVFLAGMLSDDERRALASAAPNVRIIDGLTRETALVHAAAAHGADVRVLSPELLRAAPNLVWVQALSAGVDRYMAMPELVDNDRIVFTNMQAVHGPAIADHVFASLLTLTRNLRYYDEAQRAARWDRGDPATPSMALEGRTMLVVGLGGIGSEIARRAHGFGMRVLATRRSDTPGPDFVERVGRPDDLMAMLGEADVVAVCVPLTTETRGQFDARAFGAMKAGAILANIARGPVVDTDALVDALRRGHLAGACLDVTDPEPLPASSPLWSMRNVIVTPHVASRADLTETRRDALFVENMRRFGAGEPLLNVVDKTAEY